MQEEIFGPLLPIIVYDELETAIREIKAREKPLACYVFTRDERKAEALISRLSFGGGCVNDVLLQIGEPPSALRRRGEQRHGRVSRKIRL